MKRLFIIFLTAAAFALTVGCGGSETSNSDSAKSTEVKEDKSSETKKAENIDWSGTYTYSEGGETEFGDRYWEYTIKVEKTADGNYRADKDTDGFQTMERINCTGKVVDGKLVLYFESFDEDNMLGTEGGEKGKVEGTITKTAEGKFKVNTAGADIEYIKK